MTGILLPTLQATVLDGEDRLAMLEGQGHVHRGSLQILSCTG
jgi:hypothetical protein